ncbi:hypothetical protein EYF80_027232 [Liparis tanakae]|uniref:Uncharacterized protein n=1 Tax=Liparis tanakae TaxID=230148 RepID=A0A4Z2H9M7_9TELE|nr:hypothetical protein EYF80_027232 [Liparis tanakae]
MIVYGTKQMLIKDVYWACSAAERGEGSARGQELGGSGPRHAMQVCGETLETEVNVTWMGLNPPWSSESGKERKANGSLDCLLCQVGIFQPPDWPGRHLQRLRVGGFGPSPSRHPQP